MPIHKITKKIAIRFQQGLYQWSRLHPRPMPWKGEKDPYKIWLSEIILQQTRVAQGLPYYERFIQSFPTVTHLAKAPLQKILKHWEGLGYYTRARNLHWSAGHIIHSLKGNFPNTFDEIKKLKGIGTYTAAAIASFAYDLPHAVLDGNVHRILSRYLGIYKTIQGTADKKYFQSLANQLLDINHSGLFNQAIMDFGAMCCIPKNPLCHICPLNKTCFAFNQDVIDRLPASKKKISKKTRFFHYFILKNKEGKIYIQKRSKGDIWSDLFEFPLVESPSEKFPDSKLLKKYLSRILTKQAPELSFSQILSHQIIKAYIYFYTSNMIHLLTKPVRINSINKLAMPGILAKNRKVILHVLKKQ
ncbi:MAG: A/G-specific adenine glycosylase [Saprospiraceae bacterium]